MDEKAARSLFATALRPAASVVANSRLVVLLICLVQNLNAGQALHGLPLLLALVPNALILYRWQCILDGGRRAHILFIGLEALAGAVVAFVALAPPGQLMMQGVGYLLLSALLVGALLPTWQIGFWWLLSFLPLAVASLWFMLAGRTLVVAMLSSAAVALLGRRMRRQAEQVETMVSDLAELRAAKAAAEERIVIARDLHDTMAKSAAGVRLLAEGLRDDLVGTPHEALAGQVLDAADATSREARAVLDHLRNGRSSDVLRGLAEDAEQWARRTGTQANVALSGPPVSADAACAWQLQRAFGELLTNVERHAKASSVSIQLSGDAEGVRVEIEDDGRGLPAEIIESPTAAAGRGRYGLSGVAERVRSLEGQLQLGVSELGGARSSICVPYGARLRRSVAA